MMRYSGAGNTFLIFDDPDATFALDTVPDLCHRHNVDGVLLSRPSSMGDRTMDIYNADGSHATMCGNGLRCFVHFLRDRGVVQHTYSIEVAQKLLTVRVEGDKIFTFFARPQVLKWNARAHGHSLYLVNTGVRHVVIFPDGDVDLDELGRTFSKEEGANVNIAWNLGGGVLESRTYELGLERESLACGTGAVAIAYVANRLALCGEEVKVIPPSGEELIVRLSKEISLVGPSKRIHD